MNLQLHNSSAQTISRQKNQKSSFQFASSRSLICDSKTLSHCFAALMLIVLTFCVEQSKSQGTWEAVATPSPYLNAGGMLLLSDGSAICMSATSYQFGVGDHWARLTPDSLGSYVNGTWSDISPMLGTRLYFSSQLLKDGRVYVAGGEYGTGGSYAETYDPLTDVWTACPPFGMYISDANSEILPDGKVLNAIVSGPLRWTIRYDPTTNGWLSVVNTHGSHNESTWLKMPDESILMVDMPTTQSERYIPSLGEWIVDSDVPVSLYDSYGSETGPAFLLPDGRSFWLGSPGNTAYYTPSGDTSMGTWDAGPVMPNGQGTPDAAGAMMANGKILCAVSPAPSIFGLFQSPTSYYEFDYLSNTFTRIIGPTGDSTVNEPAYYTGMLNLPDGSILYADQYSAQYYVYKPHGAQLEEGKPTINNIIKTDCNLFTITGTLFNGISEGSSFGDDWQMNTNYPVIRLNAGDHVYYARSFNWNSTGVQRGSLPDTAQFTLPANLPAGIYTLVVTANGIASDSVLFIPFPALSSTLAPPAICTNTTFTYTPTSFDSTATFTWTRAAVTGISNAAITTPQIVDPNEVLINTTSDPIAVAYEYIVTSGGCSDTEQVVVFVNPLPPISFNGVPAFCTGSSTVLTATGGTNYLWSTGATTDNVTINTAGDYEVTVTNTYGCIDSASQTVTENPNPTPDITTNGSTTFCEGESVILDAGTYASYIWSNSETTNAITVTNAGDYIVTVTDNNGCTGTAAITVYVNPLPTVNFTGLPDTACVYIGTITLIGDPPGGAFSGPGMTGNVFNTTSVTPGNNTVTYSYTDSHGCENSIDQIVYVSLCTGLTDPAYLNYSNMVTYPNPANEMVIVIFKAKEGGSYIMSLDDMLGRILIEEPGVAVSGDNSRVLDLKKLSKGMYTIILRKGDDLLKSKIVVD